MPDSPRPRVFVGSSTESLDVARALQQLLDRDCDVEVWNQGVFHPGGTTFETLVDRVHEYDYAVIVVNSDDTTLTRGATRLTPRDNAILELGLFAGALGRYRTIMVYDRDRRPDLPSDLQGVTPVDYAVHQSGNMKASLGSAASEIRDVIMRDPAGPAPVEPPAGHQAHKRAHLQFESLALGMVADIAEVDDDMTAHTYLDDSTLQVDGLLEGSNGRVAFVEVAGLERLISDRKPKDLFVRLAEYAKGTKNAHLLVIWRTNQYSEIPGVPDLDYTLTVITGEEHRQMLHDAMRKALGLPALATN